VSIARLVTAAVKDILQANSKEVSNDLSLGEMIDEVMTGAETACQEAKEEAENARQGHAYPKARRNAAESEITVQQDVAGLMANVKADEKASRLGVDPNNFLNVSASIYEMFVASTQIMCCVLGVVFVLTVAIFGVVKNIENRLAGVEEEFWIHNNNTEAALVEIEDFEEELAEEETNAAALALAVWAAGGFGCMISLSALFHNVNGVRAHVLVWCTCAMIPVGAIIFVEVGGGSISGTGLALWTIAATSACLSIFMIEFINNQESETGSYLERLASKRATQYIADGTEYKGVSLKKKLVIGILGALPTFSVLAMMMLYVTVVFRALGVYTSDLWKVLVTILAFGIKVAGNKGMLKLVAGGRPWMTDANLFAYEFVTATLLRVLQLSIPNERIAQLISLFSAVAEVCVRIFFFNRFTLAAMRTNPKDMTDEQRFKFAQRGRLRVVDGTNDMVVEYLSSLTAAMFILYLAPTGAFSFATSEAIETAAVMKLLMYQLVPELFLDFYVTFIEVQGGLLTLHELYWDPRTGGDPNSKYRANRWGDLFKSLSVKLAITIVLTCFVLMATIK